MKSELRPVVTVSLMYVLLQVGATMFPLLAADDFAGQFISLFGIRMVTVVIGVTIWGTGIAHMVSMANWGHGKKGASAIVIASSGALLTLLPVLAWVLQGPVYYCS